MASSAGAETKSSTIFVALKKKTDRRSFEFFYLWSKESKISFREVEWFSCARKRWFLLRGTRRLQASPDERNFRTFFRFFPFVFGLSDNETAPQTGFSLLRECITQFFGIYFHRTKNCSRRCSHGNLFSRLDVDAFKIKKKNLLTSLVQSSTKNNPQ